MRALFLIYQWCVAAPILLVLTLLPAIAATLGGLFDKDWWGYYPPLLWSRCWCFLLGVRVKVHGRDNIDARTQYVFVANHQGAYDIFALSGYLGHRFKWMMRKGLTNIPFVGTACRTVGYILVDPRNIKSTKEHAEAALGRGQSLVIFPEGRRTDDGSLGQFKAGAFHLAAEFNRPIVPITIDGAYRVMPRDTYNITPGTINITIHEPIVPTGNGHDYDTLSERCREAIASALPHNGSHDNEA